MLFNTASVDEWKDFYIDATGLIPLNAPKPAGNIRKGILLRRCRLHR